MNAPTTLTASSGLKRRDMRLRDPVSRSELERRWKAVREIMAEADVDAIVVQGAANLLGIGGYFRWLTGTPAIGAYPVTAIFPREGETTIISHGEFGGEHTLDPAGDQYPGAGRRLTSPALPMIAYTASYDGALAAADIKKRGCKTIALLGSFGMGFDFASTMLRDLEGAVKVVSITDAVDLVKAVKSDEEIGFIRRAAAMQDELLVHATKVIKPGMRQFEVTAALSYQAQMAGCETGFILGSSGQLDEPGPPMFPYHSNLQGKTLRENDIVLVVIENSGPGGYVTHLSRMFVLGEVSAELADVQAAVVEAQDYTLNLLRPGASCSEVFEMYNAYMRDHRLGEELRLHAHGQGFDIVERPLIRSDESMNIAANMNIGIHPGVMHRRVLMLSTDNFLIGESGSERLHKTERKVFGL